MFTISVQKVCLQLFLKFLSQVLFETLVWNFCWKLLVNTFVQISHSVLLSKAFVQCFCSQLFLTTFVHKICWQLLFTTLIKTFSFFFFVHCSFLNRRPQLLFKTLFFHNLYSQFMHCTHQPTNQFSTQSRFRTFFRTNFHKLCTQPKFTNFVKNFELNLQSASWFEAAAHQSFRLRQQLA